MPTFISTLLHRSSRRRMYSELLELDDHLLRDIGLSRADLRAAMVTRSVASLTTVHAHG
jgi:uncharacterized protein YjiS (DUF1127 family)